VRVLLVSQYYPPEVGATQNRMGAFAHGLAERGHRVTVVCEQPNHPQGVFRPGYGRRPVVREDDGATRVVRLWVAASPAKTTARRLAFYGTFAGGAAAAVAALARRHDVVLATSPPMPGALGAAAAARAARRPLVVDVRDLWPAAAEALGELADPRVIRVAERAERWLYRAAAAVTCTTRPFCTHIDRVAGRPVAVHLPNGALDALVAEPDAGPPAGPFVLGYVGNLGLAQGLDAVLDAAPALHAAGMRLRLVGDGPLGPALRQRVAREGLAGVTIEPQVPVGAVGEVLRGCHALLVPLGAHPALAGFVPSKLYDGLAAGRPLVVAAAGEPAALVEALGAGVAVPPEDPAALVAAVRALADDPRRARQLGSAARRASRRHARAAQVGRLEALLHDVARRAA